MSAPPYMKLFWGDYHKATRHLTRDQHGAYFLLIGEAWRLGGSLPDDDAKLAAWALCTPQEWASAKPIIMDFFTLRRGKWWHDRVREELASYESISRKRKQAGEKGGAASRGNGTDNRQANAPQMPTKPEPEPEPNNIDAADAREPANEPDDWPPGKPHDHAQLLVAEAATVNLDPARQPGLATTLGRLHAWRAAGASWEHDVLPTVTALARKARRPIGTWKFFDDAVAQAVADNRLALKIPEAQGGQAHEHRPDARHAAKLANLDRHLAGAEQAAGVLAARRAF